MTFCELVTMAVTHRLEKFCNHRLENRWHSSMVSLRPVTMTGTPAIHNLIREGKSFQINSMVETGSNHGMHTLAQELRRLIREGVIRAEDAESISAGCQ